jgi:hypothetical protein
MKPIGLSSHPLHNIMNPIETRSPGVCYLFKVPLEIRDLIYVMLLTTPYCTHIASTGRGLEFKLHTAILLVNRQTSVEAKRVLYQEKDFAVLKVTGINMHLNQIPQFKLLSEHKMPRPVLQIKLAAAADSPVKDRSDQRALITTPEGLQAIINSLWVLEYFHSEGAKVHHGDLTLILDFYIKAKTRYTALSELLLKPWETVNGFKDLVLTGHIGGPMREHLAKYNLEGPFPSEVAARLTGYHSISKQGFHQKDYLAVRWCGVMIDHYMTYLWMLKPNRLEGRKMCEDGNKLWNVLRESLLGTMKRD